MKRPLAITGKLPRNAYGPPSMTVPTPQVMVLLRDIHAAGGKVETVSGSRQAQLRQCVERGWLVETEDHVELTSAGQATYLKHEKATKK